MRFRHLLFCSVLYALLALIAIGIVLPSFARRGCGMSPSVKVYDVGGTMQCETELTPESRDSARFVGQVLAFRPRSVSGGWPMATSTTRTFSLFVSLEQPNRNSSAVAADTAGARRSVVNLLATDFYSRDPDFNAARLAPGDYSVTHVHWPGYLVNGLLYCVVLGLFGLWCRMLVRARAADVWQRRLAHGGVCPSCGYDLNGLVAGRCPECGAEHQLPSAVA